MKLAQGAAFRPGTYQNLKSQLKAYSLFCAYYRYKLFPCSSHKLCEYVCFISRSLTSFASVKNYLSGLKTWSQILNFNVQAFSSSELRLTLRGLHNCNNHVPRSKLPLLPFDLMRIVQLLDRYDTLDACLWSFMTMAFFGMLRSSNLISRTPSCFNPSEQLTRKCVIFTSDGIKLCLSWSKTRQGHDYIHELPICRSSEPLLCPVRAYCNFISLVPGSGDDPVFCVPVKGKLEPVSKHSLQKRFRDMLILIDLDPASYSFHSLRHGGATLAAQAEVPEVLLKHHGDWRSDCYQTYVKQASVGLYKVTKAMDNFINSHL